jgi:hypothetical protein
LLVALNLEMPHGEDTPSASESKSKSHDPVAVSTGMLPGSNAGSVFVW